MGRKRDSFVRNFYIFSEEENRSQCKICKTNFQGDYISNIRRHLEEKHQDIYNHEMRKQEENEVPEKKVKFSVSLTQSEVKEACVNFVTAERMPLSMLDSQAFKTITEQIFSGLNMNPITSRNVMSLVSESYVAARDQIRRCLENKVISLKMDTATRLNRGILCVNAQFYDGTEICIKTLGIVELYKKHTAANLATEIEAILEDFGVTKNQIYCVTTDNGRNMVKAVELLAGEIQDLLEVEDEDEIDDEDLLKDLKLNTIKSIKCAAHTLQLAVKDFLRKIDCTDIIEKARKLVKTLRTPSYRCIISTKGLPQPQLDVATRWNSTYSMLKKLLEFRDFCGEHFDDFVDLSCSEWNVVSDLVETLEPIFIATQRLQAEQLFMGDFHKLWLELTLTIKNMKNSQSRVLEGCLQQREEALMKSEILIAATYLDPRIRRVLAKNPINLLLGRSHLKQLMKQIFNARRASKTSTASTDQDEEADHHQPPTCSESHESLLASCDTSTCTLLNEYLCSIEVASCDEDSDSDDEEDMKKAICEIESFNPKPIDLNADIMQYWEEKKFTYPYLYELAQVVHSAPATQVSVERAFSTLKLILTDLRSNLSPENLKMILFVTLNK